MARIANVNIRDNKKIRISLTDIYGIGHPLALKICKEAKVYPDKKVKDLSSEELVFLREVISKGYQVEGDKRRQVSTDIKRKEDIGCYQGMRHKRNLPVRGQNTHSNARTKRKRGLAIANKKKIK